MFDVVVSAVTILLFIKSFSLRRQKSTAELN